MVTYSIGIFTFSVLVLVSFSTGSKLINEGISNRINGNNHISLYHPKAWIRCSTANPLYSPEANQVERTKGKVKNIRSDRSDPFHLKANGYFVQDSMMRDCNTLHTPEINRQKSILGISLVVGVYLILSFFYNHWRRVHEREKVAKAMEEYERDKLDYIETGNTRVR